MTFFKERKKIIKFVQNHKRPGNAKTLMSKKNKFGAITLADFKYNINLQ